MDDTTAHAAYIDYCYLASPTSGTLSLSWTGSNGFDVFPMTFKDVAQTSPIDVVASSGDASTASNTLTLTTTVGSDALFTVTEATIPGATTISDGAGQTVTGRRALALSTLPR
jgi:hypothetical protein